jgi:GDPmannose 4,6-dehydratase
VEHLQGEASKARAKLGWTPQVLFTELIQMMVDHDWDLARRERTLSDSGYRVAERGIAAR